MAQIGLINAWSSLSGRQQIAAAVSTCVVIVTMYFLVTLTQKDPQTLLFSGLDPAAAGEITTQLDGMQTKYTIKGSAIYVPDSQRDGLRLKLASQGLPSASGAGYELLDNLNGFSTTSDMFDAAYWRAKEGELTRTILSIPGIKSVRVHLGINRQSAFRRGRSEKTASVTIDAPGGLSSEQARSIQFLTALAVADLKPDHVAVIDTAYGVVAGPGGRAQSGMGADSSEREMVMENAILRMLEAHVGVGNARVTVAMEVDHQKVSQTERLIDPDSRQIASRKTSEERTREGPNSIGGAVTVASSLPDGEALQDGELQPGILSMKRDENVIYTGTEISRVIETAAGTVQRLSVAVLLNQRTVTDADGVVTPAPRTEEELDQINALISSAVGLQTARGDNLAVSVLPFEAIIAPEVITPSFVETTIMPNAVQFGQIAFLGLVVLILGLFVVKPLLSGNDMPVSVAELTDNTMSLPQDAAELLTALTAENPDDAAAILDAWFEEEKQHQAA